MNRRIIIGQNRSVELDVAYIVDEMLGNHNMNFDYV